jgi:hypothetical protein
MDIEVELEQEPEYYNILERLTDLEALGHQIVGTMHELKAAYALGYRLCDIDDKPVTGVTNVVNIAEALK